jgi:hypothetical protein
MIKVILNTNDIRDLERMGHLAALSITKGFPKDNLKIWGVGEDTYIVKKNKSSYTVWRSE